MRIKNLVYAALVPAMFSCGSEPSGPPALIPAPVSLTMTPSSGMSHSSVVSVWTPDSALTPMCGAFAEDVPGMRVSDSGANAAVRVYMCDTLSQSGAYCLDVSSDSIVVRAADAGGAAGGLATVRQLLMTCPDRIPSLRVTDYPRFGYRGVMIDVSRHFLPVDELKRLACTMSLFKFNVLHLHLSDSQGWRMWLDSHPEVAVRGTDYYDFPEMSGKFYTHADLQGLVSYASARGVEIIPEIDMPGHMQAALAAYPYLGCTGGPYEVWKQWGISDDVLCAGNDETLKFIDDVLGEIIQIFPSEYIHVGGDECPKVRWAKCPKCQARIKALGIKADKNHSAEEKLQSFIISHAEKFLNDHGRQIIGWDEILEGGLAPNATVMSWRGEGGGIEAAKQKHDVIMSPNTYLYFDYYQSKDVEQEPEAIGGYLPLERVYSYEPMPASLTPEEQKYIKGVQANLWTEYIPTFSQVEYMELPRMAALADIQWTNPEHKDYQDFLQRLVRMMYISITMPSTYSM